jgi:hypothetical protein
MTEDEKALEEYRKAVVAMLPPELGMPGGKNVT